MTNTIRTAVAAAGILATAALPLASQAASTTNAAPQRYTLQTQLTDSHHVGAYEGTLALTIYPSGIVQGTYRPADGGYSSVTGGLTGKDIWLDLGQRGRLHLTGTFENGVLKTVAAIPGPDVYEFDSVAVTRNG
ncbi:MAG: hypothetical protein QOD51_1790 [Candidatus Eremiobacteraeota bacterium]|jgi:hypothetical protein|nr:hypothetical protein [Candidatus Eremiobacteraeota bacterium]